jgi:chemotaxis regulatin CheY-phosphate phosphatase CheZ
MLNKANSAAANLLDQIVTEINTALANARERLKGVSAQGGQPAVTTQHILDEADPITLASLQAHLAIDANTDPAKANASVVALTPAPAPAAQQ